jgi:hypothetical protein
MGQPNSCFQESSYFPDTVRAPVEFSWKFCLQVARQNSLRTLYLIASPDHNLKRSVPWTHVTSGICHVPVRSYVKSLEVRI